MLDLEPTLIDLKPAAVILAGEMTLQATQGLQHWRFKTIFFDG
jgi:hypothetical protein